MCSTVYAEEAQRAELYWTPAALVAAAAAADREENDIAQWGVAENDPVLRNLFFFFFS